MIQKKEKKMQDSKNRSQHSHLNFVVLFKKMNLHKVCQESRLQEEEDGCAFDTYKIQILKWY